MMVTTVHQVIWSFIGMLAVAVVLFLLVYITVHEDQHYCSDGIRQVYYSTTRHYDDTYDPPSLIRITHEPVFVCKSGQIVRP